MKQISSVWHHLVFGAMVHFHSACLAIQLQPSIKQPRLPCLEAVMSRGPATSYSATNQVCIFLFFFHFNHDFHFSLDFCTELNFDPGFCNPYSSTVTSSSTPGLFDDGSGDANYLTNTNCTWILATSNQLSVATKIRSMDRYRTICCILFWPPSNILTFMLARLHVFEVFADASLKQLHTFKGAEPARFFSSKHGFQLHFEVSNSLSSLRGTFEDEPCTGCEGFEAVHAGDFLFLFEISILHDQSQVYFSACPPNSMLSSGSIECVCESGYEKKEVRCFPIYVNFKYFLPNMSGLVKLKWTAFLFRRELAYCQVCYSVQIFCSNHNQT